MLEAVPSEKVYVVNKMFSFFLKKAYKSRGFVESLLQ